MVLKYEWEKDQRTSQKINKLDQMSIGQYRKSLSNLSHPLLHPDSGISSSFAWSKQDWLLWSFDFPLGNLEAHCSPMCIMSEIVLHLPLVRENRAKATAHCHHFSPKRWITVQKAVGLPDPAFLFLCGNHFLREKKLQSDNQNAESLHSQDFEQSLNTAARIFPFLTSAFIIVKGCYHLPFNRTLSLFFFFLYFIFSLLPR